MSLRNSHYEITSGDFLAGGGGITEAMSMIPGLKCKWVLNHNPIAIKTNQFNHKKVKHYWADFYKQDEREMERVDFVWASIECTQHSKANASKSKKIGSYTLGWELLRYVEYLKPKMIGIENVPEFKKWAPVNKKGQPIKSKKGDEFERWKKSICNLGYDYSERIYNAADLGLPTRRVRFFCFFTKKSLRMEIPWPKHTHNKTGSDGLKKWVACRKYIDLDKEGHSIFGRSLNMDIKKGHRKPLRKNSLRRISGGIKKVHPDMYMIMQYYGTGSNTQSIDSPLNTITTKDRHALVKIEKMQFIQDYCRQDIFNSLDEPVSPQLTWQTKQLVTLEKKQMLADYYGRNDTATSLDAPANTIRCDNSKHLLTLDFISDSSYAAASKNISVDKPISTLTGQQRHQLVQAKMNFVSVQNNSNGNPGANNHSVEEPLWSITTKEKFQFISTYFNSSGNPESQNQSLDKPLNTILTGTNKKALITAIKNGLIDFDIKMRFLEVEEMSRISTFRKGYFTNPRLKLSKKDATKLIGNAVPPKWAKKIIAPAIKVLRKKLSVK